MLLITCWLLAGAASSPTVSSLGWESQHLADHSSGRVFSRIWYLHLNQCIVLLGTIQLS